jgi:hypothetical protein
MTTSSLTFWQSAPFMRQQRQRPLGRNAVSRSLLPDAPNREFSGAMARVKAPSLRSALRGLDPHHPFPMRWHLSERRREFACENTGRRDWMFAWVETLIG